MEERPELQPGPGQIRVRVEACGVCRTDLHVVDGELPDPRLPIVPGHEIVGRVEAMGDGVDARAWLPRRRGLARPCLRHCPYCRSGAREPVRCAALHRLHARRRLRHPYDRRRALSSFRSSEDARSGRGRAAPVRGPDRLALARDGRRRADDRHLRLRRRGAYHRPGLPLAGPARSSPSPGPAMRPPKPSPARSAPNGRAARTTRRPTPLDAAILFAPVGALVPAALARRAQGRAGGLRRHSHERHPLVPVPAPVGGAQRRLGGQSDPRRRRRVLGLAPRAKVRTTTTRLPARESQPGARRFARRAPPRGRGGHRAVRRGATG